MNNYLRFFNNPVYKFEGGGFFDKILESAGRAFIRPAASLPDKILHAADVVGAPSHVTNVVRDVANRAVNMPVIAANAAGNYIRDKIKGKSTTFSDAFKEADTNPSVIAKPFLIYPQENTAANYSEAELEAIKELDRMAGKEGLITARAYKKANGDNVYAGRINIDNFTEPSKVVEWSIGLSSGIKDEDGDNILYDRFAYDLKDTDGIYAKAPLGFNVKTLREILGHIGSIGYPDYSNSATSIKTKIKTSDYKK